MSKKKILVVDDEKLIVKGIRFSLEQDDMEVDCAYDGEEALQMAHNKEYDIILLDVMLPKLTGFEVCQQIRSGSTAVAGIMAESFIKEGTQKIVAGQQMVYGQSITDPCLSWEDSELLLEKLAAAVDSRF